MSSATAQSIKIDKINESVKGLAKIHVCFNVSNNKKLPFQIDGQCPTYISKINTKNNDGNVQVGDYIIKINGQNVSRGSVKSVRKILKHSNKLDIILYRHKNTKTTTTAATDELLSSSTSNQRKSVLSCFKGLIYNNHSSHNNHLETYITTTTAINASSNDDDCGYYSIPRTSEHSYNTQQQEQLMHNVNDDSHEILQNIKLSIQNFLMNTQNSIEIYVRPTIALNLLNKNEYLNLYQNIEKLVPVAKYMLNQIDLVLNETTNCINFDMLKIVFESFEIYLNGLPNAMRLLETLAYERDEFYLFLKTLKNSCSSKIFEFLLLPYYFLKEITLNFLNYFHLNLNNFYKNVSGDSARVLLEKLNKYLASIDCTFEEAQTYYIKKLNDFLSVKYFCSNNKTNSSSSCLIQEYAYYSLNGADDTWLNAKITLYNDRILIDNKTVIMFDQLHEAMKSPLSNYDLDLIDSNFEMIKIRFNSRNLRNLWYNTIHFYF